MPSTLPYLFSAELLQSIFQASSMSPAEVEEAMATIEAAILTDEPPLGSVVRDDATGLTGQTVYVHMSLSTTAGWRRAGTNSTFTWPQIKSLTGDNWTIIFQLL